MRRLFLLILALTGFSALFGFAASLSVDGGVLQVFEMPISIVMPDTGGTSLAALKSAEGFWEQEGGVDRTGVRGNICVTNGGEWDTRDLLVVDVVQIKTGPGPFVDYASKLIEPGGTPVLAAGETACYPYEILFTPVAGAKYRNTARVTITNHAGWIPGDKKCPGPEPCPFGPETKIDFVLPEPAELIGEGSIDGKRAAEQTPTPAPEDGGTEDPVEGGEASATAPSEEGTGETATSAPTATPTATGTPTATATILPTQTELPTPTPAPTDAVGYTGCTYSAEYWRWNPQAWPVGELVLGERLYSQEEALGILQAPVEADETYPLLQQLIAARLNVENGAEGGAIGEMILVADEWLELHPPGSHPPNPERVQAAALAEELEDFNSGSSGPQQCADEGSRPIPTRAPEYTEEPVPTWAPTPTPEPSPTGTEVPSPTPAVPSETPAPPAAPQPTETPLPTPTAAEELPTEAPLPTETPLPTDTPAPTDGEEAGAGETPTQETP